MKPTRQMTTPEPQFVDAVEHRLRIALAPTEPDNLADRILSEASQHLSLAEAAKRARPRLLLHFAEAIGAEISEASVREELVDVAVVAELIHTASLLHDDVVDLATVRRGQPSVNAQWGNCVAVLGGDAMLCTGLQMLESYGMEVMLRALDVVARMTRGVTLEVESRGRTDVSEPTWRAIADGKTGVLFGWCGWAPAALAGHLDTAERLHECGHHLGVAFQLADDLKDLTGADKGKHRFADLRTRTPAYPLVWAMARDEHVRDQITELWDQGKMSAKAVFAAGALVLESGALQATRKALSVEIDRALEALGEYAQRPGGREIAGFAMQLRSLLESEAA